MSQQTTRAAAHAWWVTGRPELNDLCPLQLILGQGRLAAGAEEPTKYQAEMLADPWNKRYARLLDSQCMPDDEMSPAADNDTRGALTDEGAMRIALQIMANLEDRNGVLDRVDDETKADIADDIAVAIRTGLAAPSLPAGDGLTDEQRELIVQATAALDFRRGPESIIEGLREMAHEAADNRVLDSYLNKREAAYDAWSLDERFDAGSPRTHFYAGWTARRNALAAPRQPGEDFLESLERSFPAASAQQDEREAPKLTKREAVWEVQAFCNRIPGSTQWNAAEFMYDLLTKGSIE